MEKTIVIDGRDIKLKSNGATPLKYKECFNRDFFHDIENMMPKGKSKAINVDTELLYNFVWLLAKTADKEIENTPMEWLETFDEFPLMDFLTEIQDILIRLIQSRKK